MIVVVGLPAYADSPDCEGCAGGLAVEVAAAAKRRGGAVELVGKIGDDGAGDAVVVALGRLGVGHAALLRDPARPTPVLAAEAADDDAAELDAAVPEARLLPESAESRPALEAADVELALRYLPQAGVIVLADPLPESAVAAGAEGADFAAARLIVLVPAGLTPPPLPAAATVLEAPAHDDGSFGRLVGIFAGALDAGVEPAAAFKEAVAASGWEAIAD
ncbi:MAG: PfkB family carbohydrate kinase [Candidatus Limnocylindrales bacterium]